MGSKAEIDIIIEFKRHLKQPLAIFPQVIPTLKQLARSYDLYVLTKGNIKEQKQKLDRFGHISLFKESFVVLEKNINTYQSILRKNHWPADEMCMIGNSPKSDINPALKVGMFAVFIPYAYTWKLDNEALCQGHPKLVTISKFSDLLSLFKSEEIGNKP